MANEIIQQYFDTAQLALAAYSDFTGIPVTSIDAFDSTAVKSQLIASGDFQTTAAQQFIDRFQVIDQFTDPSLLLNGFSATVFRNKQSGQTYFITRGTENSGDFLADSALAIGVTARSQIVSMVNYVLRLQAGEGNIARQIKASRLLPSNDVEWDLSRNVFGVGSGIALNQLAIAGHSLGGYLATIFGRIFNDKVAAAFTFNAPGAYGGFGLLDDIARLLGRAPSGFLDASRQTNLIGDYIVSSVPGRHGEKVRIFEEGNAHSQKSVVDALALYATFGELDSQMKAGDVRDILRATTNRDADSLEASLDGLRKIFLGPQIAATKPAGAEDTDATREVFYQNLGGLRDSAAFQTWAGQVSVVSLATRPVEGVISLARSDVSYRYALKELNPFAVTGAPGLYDERNGDGELAVYDPATGLGELTTEWLQDRAQFLTWKNQKNINDSADGASVLRKDNGVESFLYTDKTHKDSLGQDYSVRVVGGNVLQQVDPIRISFAGDQGDALSGGNYADHLYGGRGKDTLTGGEGNDYLEGGLENDTLRGDAGDDRLIGGSGVDTLVGGADNDTLDGGKGNDVLQGGAGNDIYIIRAGDGQDTILDHEGRNTVIYEDASGGRTALAMPAFAVAGSANAWRGYLAGGGTVSFTRNSPLTATLPDGTSIVIDDFQDGDLGIHLLDLPRDHATTRTIRGDLTPVDFPLPENGGTEHRFDDLGNLISGDPPEIRDDILHGSAGDDEVYSGSGRDLVQAGPGNDIIAAQGSPEVLGMDYFFGEDGADRIYARLGIDIEDAMVDENGGPFIPGSWLSGGNGDDIIVGAEGMDELLGGAGDDLLLGGGGNDMILADTDYGLKRGEFRGGWTKPFDAGWIDIGWHNGGSDIVYGGGGNDNIYAGIGDDYADGGDGNDQIAGGGGADKLFGGAGDDRLLLEASGELNQDVALADGGAGNDFIAAYGGRNILVGGDGNDLIFGASHDLIYCDGGDDIALGGGLIYGGLGNDELYGILVYGEEGDDVLGGLYDDAQLFGGEGDDTFRSGLGSDYLAGGPGNDTYNFETRRGQDVLRDEAGIDNIAFASFEGDFPLELPFDPAKAISRDSISLRFENDRLLLDYGSVGDSIDLGQTPDCDIEAIAITHETFEVILLPPQEGDVEPEFTIERLYTTENIPLEELQLRQTGTDDADMLVGGARFQNLLDGGAGNDGLTGGTWSDILIGGTGDDMLDGGDGGDRYVFNTGDGVDVISDSGIQGIDTLAFGPGISPDALSLGTGSLLIRIGGSGDAVHVDGLDWDDAGAAGGVERFEFADGTVLSHAELVSRGFDLYGSSGADVTYGTNLLDRFHESAGDDILIGGAGNDTYYFGLGSGHDLVLDLDTEPANSDTVVFGNEIAAGNVSVLRSADTLTLAIAGTDDRLAIQWQPQDGYAVERVQFADGTIWDQNLLESKAAPELQANSGTGAAHDGGIPASDGGGAGAPVSGGATQAGTVEPPVSNSGVAGLPTGDGTSPTPGTGATPVDTGSVSSDTDAVSSDTKAASSGTSAPAVDSSTPAVDSITLAVDSSTLAVDSSTPAVDSITHPADPGPTSVADATPPDPGAAPSVVGGVSAGNNSETVSGKQAPISGVSTTEPRKPQAAAIPGQQDALATAMRGLAATESTAAPPPTVNTAKPVDVFNVQSAGGQSAAGANPASFFTALQPVQPSLQTWLDNWLGPRARASSSAGEASDSMKPGESDQPSSLQDPEPFSLQSDIPDAQPAEALTPEEIARSYEDISLWLAANPGTEQGTSGASGSMPERNLFACIGTSCANDAGMTSMPGFGAAPGMAAIAGNSLQALRGVREGYTLLSAV